MAAKELKLLVKAARTALDKQDYQGAIKHCEAVFWVDDRHYLAHVIAGKAQLQLGQKEEARNHYKKAIESNSNDRLAWKGLADFYDKHPAHEKEEKLEAIEAYIHILDTTSDNDKRLALLQKIAPLQSSTGLIDKATSTYLSILDTTTVLHLQLEALMFLLIQSKYCFDQWSVITEIYKSVISNIDDDITRQQLNKTFINGAIMWIKLGPLSESVTIMSILRELCERLIKEEVTEIVNISFQTLIQLELWKIFKDINVSCPELSQEQITLFSQFSTEETNLYYITQCLLQLRDIKKACQLIDKAVSLNPNICENHVFSSLCHMMSHDYMLVIMNTGQAMELISQLPTFLSEHVEHVLKLWLVEALLLEGQDANLQQALSTSQALYMSKSHDSHVTELYFRTLIATNNFDEAEKVLTNWIPPDNEPQLMTSLQGQICLAKRDYKTAADKFELVVKQVPQSSLYYYLLGTCYWYMEEYKTAYSYLIKSAQLDPFNPHIFLLLGHYQRIVTTDLKRAVKCYQKAFSINPGLVEAGMALGEALSSLGEEKAAYDTYVQITTNVSPVKAKEAWLRIGLYHRVCGQFNDSIKCFLKVLHQDTSDYHVWECVGEVYLARGSHISAMKAFMKAVQLNPQSLYCQYQVAAIQQVIGQLSDAIKGYTTVLELEKSYIPALKGRAESYFKLASEALDNTFDGKAVDYVSLALHDLTHAVQIQCAFVCLWQLIGDCCLCLNDVAYDIVRPRVPVLLLGDKEGGSQTINKEQLLQIGTRAYGQALQLCEGESPYLLHNLAVNYYYLGKIFYNNKKDVARDKLQVAIKLIKRGVTLLSSSHTHWTTLGVIASHPLLNQLSLAQHAFIKSLNIEPNNAIAWANYGALCLINGKIMLAHKAFEKAQSCDPSYVQGWIGDALVAETIGKEEEAKNFFRISSELQYHSESALGYAYWVSHTLSEKSSGYQLSSAAHQRMVQARDGIEKYILRHPNDPCGLNLLGILYEQEGLVKPAKKTIEKACMLSEGHTHSLSLTNYARLLSCIGKHSDAIASYQSLVTMDTLTAPLDHAIALFRAGKQQEAKSVYQQLLTSCDTSQRPLLLLACAICVFADKDLEECKNLLFKVFQTPPPSLHGLISLATFAGYSNDITLLQATLKEILKLVEFDTQPLHPMCYSVLHAVQAVFKEHQEIYEVIDEIHDKLPMNAELKPLPLQMSNVMRSLFTQTPVELLKVIQKLIHTYPDYLWVWPFLPYVLLLLGDKSKMTRDLTGDLLQLIQLKAGMELEDLQSKFIVAKMVHESRQENLKTLVFWSKLLFSTTFS